MKKTVFVIDDSPCNLRIASSALSAEYRVIALLSAKRMFSLFDANRPDLILLDIEMPEMDGFEAITELKKHPEWKTIPVVFYSSLDDDNLHSRAFSMNAVGVIKKPMEPSQLLECVNNYIQMPSTVIG